MGARPVLATIALGVRGGPMPHGSSTLSRHGGARGRGVELRARRRRHRARAVGVARDHGRRRGPALAAQTPRRRPPRRRSRGHGAARASRAGLAVVLTAADLAGDRSVRTLLRDVSHAWPGWPRADWLGASRNVRAMMDCSDGLSTDVSRICAASGVGAVLESIAVDDNARRVAELLKKTPTAARRRRRRFCPHRRRVGPRVRSLAARFAQRFGRPLLRVGTFTAGSEFRRADGSLIIPGGWDHFSSARRELSR